MWILVSGIHRPVRGSESCECLSEKSRQAAYGISKRDSRGRIKAESVNCMKKDPEKMNGIVLAVLFSFVDCEHPMIHTPAGWVCPAMYRNRPSADNN